ncbi:MAG: ABC transporter permease, partial [Aeromicrobium sp.]
MSGRDPLSMGVAPARASDFRGALRRLLRSLFHNPLLVWSIFAFGVVATAMTVVGPKIMGHATDIVFTGFMSSQYPAGASKAEVVAGLRAEGDDRVASMVQAMDLQPGSSIDFTSLGWVLVAALALYVGASLLSWTQGRLTTVVVQRTVADLRDQVESKLARLPLAYFDSKPRGEIMSRTTNDIDNISQSLQQTMSQLLTSFLTVVGVLVMMLLISPLLALVALVTIPAAVFIARTIAKRSQPQFIAQWSGTGRLNGHIEEVFTGHEIVKVFGRQE